MRMLYIPEGFAHGFQALNEIVEMIYYTTEFYSPEKEGGMRYNDPIIGIDWPLEVANISKKDNELPFLKNNFEGIEV